MWVSKRMINKMSSQNGWDIAHLTAPNSKLAAFAMISNPVRFCSYILLQLKVNICECIVQQLVLHQRHLHLSAIASVLLVTIYITVSTVAVPQVAGKNKATTLHWWNYKTTNGVEIWIVDVFYYAMVHNDEKEMFICQY